MDQNDIIWIALIAGFIYFVLFGIVISMATGNAKKNRLLEAQVELLIKLAQKQGVTQDEIEGIRNNMKRQPIM